MSPYGLALQVPLVLLVMPVVGVVMWAWLYMTHPPQQNTANSHSAEWSDGWEIL